MNRQEAGAILVEKMDMDQPSTLADRQVIIKLPLSERRRILSEHANRIAAHYEEDDEWRDLDGLDIVEY